SGQQFRKRDTPTAEVRLAVQLEPVDVGVDAELQLTRLPDLTAVRFDGPTFRHQVAHGRPQFASHDFHVVSSAPLVDQPLEPRLRELHPRDLFQVPIADQTSTRLPFDDRTLRTARANQRARVIEL